MRGTINYLGNIVKAHYYVLKAPNKITFALTYTCNLRCKTCSIWNKELTDELSVSEIGKIFEKIPSLNWLDLTGGEITLREDLEEVLERIIQSSPYLKILHLTSNGQRPTRFLGAIESCKQQSVNPVVSISIDGPEALHDTIRGKSGAYDMAIDTYRKVRHKQKDRASISCTLSRYNLDHIDCLLQDLSIRIPEFSLAEIHFNIFHESNHFYQNYRKTPLNHNDFQKIVKHVKKARNGHFLKKILEARFQKASEEYFLKGRHSLPCQSLVSTCFLDPEGEVYPCTIYDKGLGNLREHNFDIHTLWNADRAAQVRENIRHSSCPGCCSPCETYPAIINSILFP